MLKAVNPYQSIRAVLEGRYVFIVFAEEPLVIYCAPEAIRGHYRTYFFFKKYGFGLLKRPKKVYGHTSISYGDSVILAGELHFKRGQLDYWNNDSGHYQSSISSTLYAMLPPIQLILPRNKFRPTYSKPAKIEPE